MCAEGEKRGTTNNLFGDSAGILMFCSGTVSAFGRIIRSESEQKNWKGVLGLVRGSGSEYILSILRSIYLSSAKWKDN